MLHVVLWPALGLIGTVLLAWATAGVRPRPALRIDHESGALHLASDFGPVRCVLCAPAEQSFGSPATAVAPAAPEPIVIARALGHMYGRPTDESAPSAHAIAPLDPPPNI